jgi:hypothetical protein
LVHTTTIDTNADVNVGETLLTEKKDNFVDLELHDLRFEKLERGSVNTDKTLSTLAVSDGSSGFL